MSDVIEYLGDSIRPLKEGSNLYQCGHVLSVGVTNIKERSVDIHSQVIQSSNPRGLPHQIKIIVVKGDVHKWLAKCSCKAGLGQKCKHIFATLLHLLNFDGELDLLSSTDVQQVWGTTNRERVVELFDAKLIAELCCVKEKSQKRKLSAEVKQSNFKRLVAGMCQ